MSDAKRSDSAPSAEPVHPDPIPWDSLVREALEVRRQAYAPYSRFRVGAALLAGDGRVFTGVNVENRSYGLTVCAERTAVGAAAAAGALGADAPRPRALVVATDASPPGRPCGMCRETLAEFARDLPILLVNPQGERDETTLAYLFPDPFEFSPS